MWKFKVVLEDTWSCYVLFEGYDSILSAFIFGMLFYMNKYTTWWYKLLFIVNGRQNYKRFVQLAEVDVNVDKLTNVARLKQAAEEDKMETNNNISSK